MQIESTEINRNAVDKALRILEVFRGIDVEMPIGEAAALVRIALGQTLDGGGLSVSDVRRQLACAMSTASRYTNSLASANRNGEAGRGLVANPRDPTNDARKILRLTPKGVFVIRQLDQILGDK